MEQHQHSESSLKSKSNLSHGAQKILDQLQADGPKGGSKQQLKDSELSGLSSHFEKENASANDDENDSNVDNSDEDIKAEDVIIRSSELIYQPESQLREWLRKHGKQDYIDFQEDELNKLRTYFNSLDDDGSGSIGVDELEDPLIALGLVDSRQQVNKIVELVDENCSAKIEFGEFLSIIKGGSAAAKDQGAAGGGKSAQAQDSQTGAIYDFFKKLTSGKFKIKENANMPFQLFISSFRRKKILESMMGESAEQRMMGEKILENYKKQLADRMARERLETHTKEMVGNMMESQKGGRTQGSAKNADQTKRSGTKKAPENDFMQKRAATYYSNEVPDPDELRAILYRKSKHFKN